ncbi:hypothetical protein [Paractinoplanes atraurantiacus]|uniref:hypothetical protein n=1 Tax=Paractinoplanes atraurantiacus TaxID=1036182 RepID=UPI0015CF1CA7|nr:hypothetical protein [Actinoplanes atraurantiacus]
MGTELATAATGTVLGFFRRMLMGTPDRVADEAAQRVVGVLDNLGRGDPATRSALATLRAQPDDHAARVLLEQRIDLYAQHNAQFRQDLSFSLGAAPHQPFRPAATGAMVKGAATGAMVKGAATGAMVKGAALGTRVRDMARNPGSRRLLIGAGALLLVVLLGCGGAGFAFLRGNTTVLDNRTDLTAPGGWSYRVSEAHLKTSPQLEDRAPAKPGYRYLYFDITVENKLDDREAPGIRLSFARAEDTMSPGCGAQQTGFFGFSNYAQGVVPGWCVSRSASCFETNDSFFRTVDRIPPGGKNELRCVDDYFVEDGFDLGSLRVYYLGDSYTQIPTST